MADKRELLFNLLGRETVSKAAKSAEKGLADLGDEFGDTQKAADKLDKQTADLEKSLRELAVQFANTGDDKFIKSIREGERELRKLNKASKLIGKDFGSDMAEGVSVSFSQKIGPLLAKAPIGPAGAIAGGILGAAIAPTLGAAIGGAIVGGAGIGGVVGGLALAAKNPAVKAAGSKLANDVMRDLEDSAQVFVKPAIQGIEIVRAGFRAIRPDIDKIFGNSSRFVEPLITGAVKGVRLIVSGVAEAVAKADPIIHAFGRGFETIGGAVGEVFKDLADNADEGASAIDDLTMAAKNFVLVSGAIIDGTAHVKGELDELDFVIDELRKKLEDKTGWDLTGDGMSLVEARAKEAGGPIYRLGKWHSDAAQAARGQASALDELATELQKQTSPAFALIEAQRDLAASKKDYNEAVKEHGRKSPEAQEALRNMAQAAITLQGAVGGAAGTFDGKLTPAMRATLRSAGFTEAELDDLEAQFRAARRAGEAFAKNYKATVTTVYREVGRAVPITNNYQSGIGGRASGGPVKAGTPYIVGEEGPELITPTKDGWVHDAQKTASMMSSSGTGRVSSSVGGGIVISGPVYVQANNPEELIDGLRKKVRANGGNVQSYLGWN